MQTMTRHNPYAPPVSCECSEPHWCEVHWVQLWTVTGVLIDLASVIYWVWLDTVDLVAPCLLFSVWVLFAAWKCQINEG